MQIQRGILRVRHLIIIVPFSLDYALAYTLLQIKNSIKLLRRVIIESVKYLLLKFIKIVFAHLWDTRIHRFIEAQIVPVCAW